MLFANQTQVGLQISSLDNARFDEHASRSDIMNAFSHITQNFKN